MKQRADAPLEHEKCGVATCWKPKGFAGNYAFLGKIKKFCIQRTRIKVTKRIKPNNSHNSRRNSDDWRNIRGDLLVYTSAADGAAQVSQRVQKNPAVAAAGR
jgi:hypothetical protein